MIDWFFATKYPLALVIIILSAIFSKIFFVILKKIVHRLTRKTKTTLDDKILEVSEKPFEAAMILFGIYIALSYVNIMASLGEMANSIFSALGVVVGLWFITSIANGIVKWYNETQELSRVQKTVYFSVRNIAYVLVLIIGFVTILHIFGFELTPIVASLGIGGLAVALALQSTLTNYFSGLQVAADGSVKIGDYIEIDGGPSGYVQKISWRSTKIRTLSNNLVVIPNSRMAENILTNYYDPTEDVSVIIPCGVAYGSDLEKVEYITLETAKTVLETCDEGVKDFEPLVRFNKFADSNIEFNVILRARNYVSRFALTHKFIKELDKAYKKNKIEISWPVRKVYMSK